MDLDEQREQNRNKYENRRSSNSSSSFKKYIPWLVIGLIAIIAWSTYNGITKADIKAEDSWAKVQTSYQSRADKVKNLVATVKGAADYEKETLTEVVEARAKATSITIDPSNITPEQLQAFEKAQSQLTGALSKLLVTVERYPNLKAVEGFRDFQAQYEGIENRIKKARDDYNTSVRNYNIKLRKFPNNLFNAMYGFEKREFFKAQEGTENAPDVAF